MEQEKIQALIAQFDQQLSQLNETVAQLSNAYSDLIEENNRLRLMNHEWHGSRLPEWSNLKSHQTGNEEASQFDSGQTAKMLGESSQLELGRQDESTQARASSGKERLQTFYEEGIHICHPYFGSRREPGEECMFCQSLLDGLEGHSQHEERK
ncbi:initiation control protein YabA [Vaginisenegalia massiliensis]|uniref:initiation control protein YabA n=1 Tax=Vaginisenegalia massiliensis TaxID=2058294 RepID=UPI000F528DAA|nr:initiation control protein YabA [Vaginisenegalia massiliensis]